MSTSGRGTKRKPVSARGKGPGTRDSSGRAAAVDLTAAYNKESEDTTSAEDVTKELHQGITREDELA